MATQFGFVVQPAEAGAFEGATHGAGDRCNLAAELADLLFERLSRLRMKQVVDDDAGALPGQFENDRLTDPAIAAGDDGGLVAQRH